jgi:hypothetical protein
MFPDTYCAFCHNRTATGCEHCNPSVHGRIDFFPDPPDLEREIEEIKKRLDKLENKDV